MEPRRSWKQIIIMIYSIFQFLIAAFMLLAGIVTLAMPGMFTEEFANNPDIAPALASLTEQGIDPSSFTLAIGMVLIVIGILTIIVGVLGLRAAKPVNPKTTGFIVFLILSILSGVVLIINGNGVPGIVNVLVTVFVTVLAFMVRSDAKMAPQPGYGQPMGDPGDGYGQPMGGPQGGYGQPMGDPRDDGYGRPGGRPQGGPGYGPGPDRF